MDLVLQTTYLSLLAQLLTGFYGLLGIVDPVPPEHQALQTSLQIEMAVQLVELVFYVWFVRHFDLATMAATRYRDWIVSTPAMLVSAMLYYHYEQTRQEGQDTTDSTNSFLRSHRQTIAIVVAANALMIAFGYFGEIGFLYTWQSAALGFVGYGIAFYTMWSRLASKSKAGTMLFRIMAFVWALYGVAFLLPTAQKNIAYNGLDVVAKNFFGVYLAHKILSLK
jgi:bacteriorhodopsin